MLVCCVSEQRQAVAAIYYLYRNIYLSVAEPTNQNYPLQRIKVFLGSKNVVISSKTYDIHKLALNLYILNKSVLG